ncbi:metalloregulator ArsR/SmtB family transcription factor [Magnetospirillum sp. 64-120]|uniref:metalloregulator ArsR/SmtB family transcription factor n=1 Tax=Magnetospirillum sp. 64-120 TaxID=1895778 RepID=UPI0025BD3616|nr:metalloregulator ArsR/SmtB family transcription factor [Magnetospirillum sp. 64-120]
MIAPNDFYRSLADETRLRCLVLLVTEGELCVCELTHAIDAIQPKVSRHLATLRNVDLVVDRKRGQWVFYSINPYLPEWAWSVLRSTAVGVGELAPFIGDRRTLHAMDNRPGRCGVVESSPEAVPAATMAMDTVAVTSGAI